MKIKKIVPRCALVLILSISLNSCSPISGLAGGLLKAGTALGTVAAGIAIKAALGGL